MRPINRADEALAQRVRDAIAGKPQLKPARPKRVPKPKQMVSQFHSFDPRSSWHTLQLPIYLERMMWNAGGTTWVKRKAADNQRETTLLAMRSAYHWDDERRARIQRVEFVRLSPAMLDDDNLRSAFKYCKDAVYAWIEHGDRLFNIRGIGHSDRRVTVPCDYRQQKCERNPRAHGIQIRLYV